MQIEKVESILAGRWHFVRITTDSGLVGVGESGIWGYPEASERIVDAWSSYLIGKNPLRIEHHWQYLARNSHFMGSAVGGALGAIDIALWDIAGKHYQAPVYDLLGGKCRDKVRCYMHVNGDSAEDLAADAKRAVARGFTAVRFTPFRSGYTSMRYGGLLREAVARVGAVRESVGPDVDLCVEIHRRMSPMEAIGLSRELAEFRPYFLEDPILPDSVQAMAEVQKAIEIPIATGERFTSMYQFRELLEAGGCRFVRPDVCICGGISNSKKVAALAEAYHVGVIPHNPLSPISTAACVQIDACIPNFALQEYTGEEDPPKRDLVVTPLALDNGYLRVPESPGIGIELNFAVVEKMPFVRRELATPLHEDGSVADQ
ncbi:MAG TPA: galactonate dehydratase [Chloroflexota bacterium]|nr:galactonate dehydratase [Chloroflexota bacterium]